MSLTTYIASTEKIAKEKFFFQVVREKIGFFREIKNLNWCMDPLHVPNEANWALKVFDPFVYYSFITGISEPAAPSLLRNRRCLW